jgi:hypothetical protein
MRTSLRFLSIARVTLTVALLMWWGACAHHGEPTASPPAVSAPSIDGEWVLVGKAPIVATNLTIAQGSAQVNLSEGHKSKIVEYRLVKTAGRRTDFVHVQNGRVEPGNITSMVVFSSGHALWIDTTVPDGTMAYRFAPIPSIFHGTHPMDPNPDHLSTVAVSDRSILLTFGNGKTEEFVVRTVTHQDATTIRVATSLGTLVLTREGERMRLDIEPARVNARIQYTGHFEGRAKAKANPAVLPSQVVPDGRYAVACLRDVSDLRGQFDVRGNTWTRFGSNAEPSHITFKPVKAIGDNWQLVQATLTGVRSPREFTVERFAEGYIIQGTQEGDGDYDVSVAYPTAWPPNWSPIPEFDEYLKVAFATLAQQDSLTRTQMRDIFLNLATEKHLALLWYSFLSAAIDSSRPCQKMADMVGNFGATLPQGPGMDKLQALCRTIPPSDEGE